METIKFKPNLENIEKRSKIVPYGRADKQHIDNAVEVPFIVYTTKQEIKEETFNATGIYKPSVMLQASATGHIRSDVSVKITNIPLDITQPQLVEKIYQKLKEEQTNDNPIRPFTRLTLVYDREKKISRGLAYANCENVEKARTLSKAIRNIVIDSCVLGAEIVE
jgi:hypothetical protein